MSRLFAIVPAAGKSLRMGQPKLLMPWGKGTVLDAVVDAWKIASVDEIVVVTTAQRREILQLCRDRCVHVITPQPPPIEMKDSVLAALNYLSENCAPHENDLWLLAPADLPTLSPAVIKQVADCAKKNPQSIVVPQYAGRNGHPAALPWLLAQEVARLGKTEGVNTLVKRHGAIYLQCGEESVPDDIDTPEEYRQLRKR